MPQNVASLALDGFDDAHGFVVVRGLGFDGFQTVFRFGHVARVLQNPHSRKGCLLGVRVAEILVGSEVAPVGSEFFFERFLFGGSNEVVHFFGWFGVGRFQWRRGERKIFLHPTQELSVKSFYAPFLRLNDQVEARDQ
jgi:hypothetical protein